ncbi:hypothetical protein, partial [Paenibacillus terrae]
TRQLTSQASVVQGPVLCLLTVQRGERGTSFPLRPTCSKEFGDFKAGSSEAGHLNLEKRQRSPLLRDSYH